ncbi:MAG: carbohydrate kinase family protein [Lachnospiraceae bacterium]|nr:carbohydrate kinase family protein [Lachnospiraceae bacterium]
MAKILCMGMALADVLVKGLSEEHMTDEIRLAEEIEMRPGGDAFNEAVILARLGNEVRLAAEIGDDGAADFVIGEARKQGVDVRGVIRNPEFSTRIMLLTIDERGERRQISKKLKSYLPGETFYAQINGADVVSLASLFRPPFDEKEAILKTAKRAKEQGAIVCADIKTNDGSKTLADFGEALSYIDYIFPNEAEARFHTGKETPREMGQVLLDLGFGHVVIKLGSRGCYACSKEEGFFMPSFLVKAVDSTGAGDNFAAGFMTALAEGKSFNQCCRFASAVAAVSVQSLGAISGVKSRAQVEEFIRSRTAERPVVGRVDK